MKMSPIWMLVLLLSSGWVYSAPHFPQSEALTVVYGGTAVLPCDGSAFMDEENPEVSWEAMGTDLAAINGDSIIIDDKYKGRVRFASEGQTGADFSLILDQVKFSDSDMYQCIWRGTKALSTVWLTVDRPQVDTVFKVYPYNVSVTLPCYLDLPRNLSTKKLNVWWEKDGVVLIERIQDRIIFYNTEAFISTPDIHIIYKFPLTSVNYLSPGYYRCWYRILGSKNTQPGIPGTIHIEIEDYTEDWGSGWSWSNFSEVDSKPTKMPVFLNSVPWPTDESTTFSPMEAHEETATSYPDGSLLDDPEVSMDWSDFPWVRAGLIAGVLFVTGAALSILGALHKL